MADKYVKYNSSGNFEEVSGQTTSAGAGDAGKIVALDGAGKLDSTLLPTGVGADTTSIEASENLAAGDFVNIHESTGAKVRKADASDATKPAHGFVLASVTSGNNATVYFEGENNQVSGLTAGAIQFLDTTTAGGTTETPPSTTGNIAQRLGVAKSATSMDVDLSVPVVRA